MTNEEKDKTYDKWGSIINSMGITGSKADWMAEYANKETETLHENTLASDDTTSDFPSILPMAMRVASQTVGLDLVSVKPMESINHEEMDRIKNELRKKE